MIKQLLLLLMLITPVLQASEPAEMLLVDVEGNQQNLSSYQGKWVVVNYWATWCPPCIAEMPDLQDFHDRHAADDAIVIGINHEQIEKSRLLEFLDDYFITYPVFVSDPGSTPALGVVPGLPTTFLVSPQGKLVARQVGSVTSEMIEQFMRSAESQ